MSDLAYPEHFNPCPDSSGFVLFEHWETTGPDEYHLLNIAATLCGYDTRARRLIRQAKAEGWDEGYISGHEDARAVQPTHPQPTLNPYAETQQEDQS